MAIVDRARLMESVRLHRKKLMTSLGNSNMQKVEGSVAKLRKPLAAKTAVKSMGAPAKPFGESCSSGGNLREASRTNIIKRMLSRIAAAKGKGLKNPGNAAGKMSIYGDAGVTVVDHHGALSLLQKPSHRNMVCIKSIMNSDRSITSRASLRESAMEKVAKGGYARGAPIIKSAADAYNKNRLLTKGNLKTSMGDIAKKGVDMLSKARDAVKTGTLTAGKKLAQASTDKMRTMGAGTAPMSRYASLTSAF